MFCKPEPEKTHIMQKGHFSMSGFELGYPAPGLGSGFELA